MFDISKAFQKKSVKRVLLVFLIVVVFFFLFNDLFMPWFVRQRGETAIPLVVGLPYEEAQELLSKVGLEPYRGDVRADRQYPIGTVISQNPPAGKTVHKSRRVYLTLSGGERHVIVPNLRGRTLRDAKFQLEREGLSLGLVRYEGSDEYPENTIIKQSLIVQRSVKRGTAVGVVVSTGRLSERVAVPVLVNKTLAEVTKILESIGLTVGNITYQAIPDVLPNTVIDQFPRVGEFVDIGGKVDIFVAQSGETIQDGIEN